MIASRANNAAIAQPICPTAQRVQPTIRQVVGLSGRFRWLFFADLFEILLPLLLRQFAPLLPGALRRCSCLGSG